MWLSSYPPAAAYHQAVFALAIYPGLAMAPSSVSVVSNSLLLRKTKL